MVTISQLLNVSQKKVVEKHLSSLNAEMIIKTSVGGGNSRKGIHQHEEDECEIFIILSGYARMEVDGKTIQLGKKDGEIDFLLTEGGVHGLFDKSEDFHCIIILFKTKNT